MNRAFSFTQKIRFSHCDPAGILYFPHVFDFVNTTVEDWFERGLGMPFHAFHMEHFLGNPVVKTECEFLRPCRFGEELVLELAPTHIGRSSIEMRIVARVAGEERMRLRHRTAMISMENFRPISIPDGLRTRALEFLADGQPPPAPRGAQLPRASPPSAFRTHQLVRYAHCDPGGIVYFARFFNMFDAVLEDWFAEALGAPWGSDFVGARNLRTPSLFITCEFLRACRLGERLDFDLSLTRLGRSSVDVAIAGSVAGEERMRVAWALCVVSHETWKSVPIPDDLRARMQGFVGPGS
ncbi:MAG: acyl-CoA thioesterase [Betaproteobacteria bacterium]|nr:acyl-CoA thioesterase [Betaproteobacteria bacterium]